MLMNRLGPPPPPSSSLMPSDPQRLCGAAEFTKCNSEERKRIAISQSLPRERWQEERCPPPSASISCSHFLLSFPWVDNSFLLPHATLLSNDLDPTLTEHFLLPSMIPDGVGAGGIVVAGPALSHPGKTTSKGHGRKVQSLPLSSDLPNSLPFSVLFHWREAEEKGDFYQRGCSRGRRCTTG
jgi:hypothetical protein